jgi:uncharacterized protein
MVSVHLQGRVLVAGAAEGPALVLDAPLSLWGGLDARGGLITDRHHPQLGASVSGRVLVLPSGRGSSSSASVLAEAIRVGTGPLAILLGEPDEILAVGAIVAEFLYGRACPVLVLPTPAGRAIVSGDRVAVTLEGTITVDSGDGGTPT